VIVTTNVSLVQVLPSSSDETLKILEENIGRLPNVSDLMAMGMGLDQMVEVLLDGIGVDEESRGFMTASYGPCEKISLQVLTR
jgi:redox-regulated HSP33 family molecular chaperone